MDGHHLIRLRNPWGKREWNGDWSDDSPLWTRRLKRKLEWVKAEDGAFWMSFYDFVVHFEDIYVCRLFESDKWLNIPPIYGEWAGRTAGGCTNFDSVVDSPQYFLTVESPCTVVINLSQEDPRGTEEPLFAISVEVYYTNGQRITNENCGDPIASNPESYIYRREVTLEFEALPSPHPYTVLVSTFAPNEERDFTLRVYSSSSQPIKFEAASDPAPVFTLDRQGSLSRFSSRNMEQMWFGRATTISRLPSVKKKPNHQRTRSLPSVPPGMR